jgi:anti-sigma regulatory factor (Ser/Thr protein kinase)
MVRTDTRKAGFSHEALLYHGHTDRIDQLTPFVREGIALGETPCVVVDRPVIDGLTRALGHDAEQVRFADMRVEGRNPGRLISVWTDLVNGVTAAGGTIRGVGEPVWAGRTDEELLECSRHEALLNLAFADGPAWRLACPYDVSGLAPEQVDEARRNHPALTAATGPHPSTGFRAPSDGPAQLTDPLSAPPAWASTWDISSTALATLRRGVALIGSSLDVAPARVDDLALALDEVASNSLKHGDGGTASVWATETDLVAQVEDAGRIEDPLVGRRRPAAGATSGFGLWLAHQLCDLVQVRSTGSGTVVRLRVSR